MIRKIAFPYENQSKQIPFVYADRNRLADLRLPVAQKPRSIILPVQVDEAVRKLSLSIGRDKKIILFPVPMQEIVPATLGAMDPYTLGELDAMSLNFLMWADSKQLIFNGTPGANGESIFLHGHPKHLDFWYNRDVSFPFSLGKRFMDTWYLPFLPIESWLCAGVASPLPDLVSAVETAAMANGMNLHTPPAELVGYISLYCKSVLGLPLTLGEMDPYTLGQIDPYPLWALSYTTASAMELGTTTATAETVVEAEPEENIIYLHTSTPSLSSQIAGETQNIGMSMMSFKCWRDVTLGDLDGYTLGELDPLPLGMKFFDDTPAIVTVDEEITE